MLAYTFYEGDNRVRRCAEALARRGDHVDVVALRREGQPRLETIRGVHIHRIQLRRIDERGPLSYLRKLSAFFLRSTYWLIVHGLKKPFDIIHVHSVPDFEVFATLVPRLIGAKIILDIHDIVPEFYASKFNVSGRSFIFRMLVMIERLSASYCHHVIISNHLWHQRLTKRSVKPHKCTTLINYPDRSIFSRRPRTRANAEEFVLCYPGTLNAHQGVDLAICAISQLRECAPSVRLQIIGDGPDREKLKRMVAELGLNQFVTITGFIPMEQVAEAIANADLGIVPKRSDSFGNEAFSTKILEFMAMGVPVLASRTAVDQFYFDDELVQFFEPQNVDDMAAKILQLMHDKPRCQSLQDKATGFIERNNWNQREAEYLNLVDRLVGQPSLCEEPA